METIGGLLGTLGFLTMAVAIWALIRGRLAKLRISSRKVAWRVLAGGFVMVIIGGSLIPKKDTNGVAGHVAEATSSTTAKPTTTTTAKATTTTTAKPATTTAKETTTTTVKPTTTTTGPLYPGRPGAKSADQERRIGEAAEFNGYQAEVARYVYGNSTGENLAPREWIAVAVGVANTSSKSNKSYSPSDWTIQTPSGQVHGRNIIVPANEIGYGSLVPGGMVAGWVYFHVGQEHGDFYVIYDPYLDFNTSGRGVWRIHV